MQSSRLAWPLKIELPGGVALAGDLAVPDRTVGLVIFAHGSGSSRHSPRNQAVASDLASSGLATLLLDLLTTDEERLDRVTSEFRFDINLLCRRLTAVVDWVLLDPAVKSLPIGIFGASTGAAGALCVAARRPTVVQAVVSRGGRPDLAESFLPHVMAPTLLIVGERDQEVIRLNRQAHALLPSSARMAIVPNATHLFEEPGALEQVAILARDWFLESLRAA